MPTQGLSIGTATKDADSTMNWFVNKILFPGGMMNHLSGGKYNKLKKGDHGGFFSGGRHPIISGINPDGSVMGVDRWRKERYGDRGGVNDYAVVPQVRAGFGIPSTNII